MKKALTFILAVVMLFSLAACGGKPSDSGSAGTTQGDTGSSGSTAPAPAESDGGVKTITIGVASDLQSFDPANNDSTASECILHNMFSHLYTQNAAGETVADLATGYEILDDTTWQFKLRDDAYFWNGDQVTAEDVKFSLERPATDTSLRENQYFNAIAGVDVVDATTVNIRTADPYPALLSLISKAGSEILPKNYVESCGGMEGFQAAPVGSGPYVFVSWAKDDSVVIEKNENYFDADNVQRDFDRMVFKVIPEESTRVAELLTGNIDIAENISPNGWDQVNNNDGTSIVFGDNARDFMILCDCTSDSPISDVRVRQALECAIDTQLICDTILAGSGHPTRTRCPAGVFGHDPSLDNVSNYNPDRAKELLAEAGYADGVTIKMTGVTGRYVCDSDIEQAIVAMAAQVGINIQLELFEFSTFSQMLSSNAWEDTAFVCYGVGFMDGSYPMNLYLEASNSGMNWNNAEYEALFNAARSNMDLDERLVQFQQCQQLVAEELPSIQLIQPSIAVGVKDTITYTPSVISAYYCDWITDNAK